MDNITGFSAAIDKIAQPLFSDDNKASEETLADQQQALTDLTAAVESGGELERTEAADVLYNLMYHPNKDISKQAAKVLADLSERGDSEASQHAKRLSATFVQTYKSVEEKAIENLNKQSGSSEEGHINEPIIDPDTVKCALSAAVPYCLTDKDVAAGERTAIQAAYKDFVKDNFTAEEETQFDKDLDAQKSSKKTFGEIKAELDHQFRLTDTIKVRTTYVECARQKNTQCGANAVKNSVALRNEELTRHNKELIPNALSLDDPISSSPIFQDENAAIENIDTQQTDHFMQAYCGDYAPIPVLSVADFNNNQAPAFQSKDDDESISVENQEMNFGRAALKAFKNRNADHFEIVLHIGQRPEAQSKESNGHYIAVQGVWKGDDSNEIDIKIADSLRSHNSQTNSYDAEIRDLLTKEIGLSVL